MSQLRHTMLLMLFSIGTINMFGCKSDRQPDEKQLLTLEQKRVYRIEKIAPAQVVQLYADGFENLSLKEKTFTYYLYLASIAARDISIDQHHRNALEVRDLFEEVYTHSASVDPNVKGKITHYLKLFWVNNGFYDNLTGHKFVPECTYDELRQAVATGIQSGARFTSGNETIDQKLERLRPVIFDPKVDSQETNKTPGEDWIKGSAVNCYGPGLTYDEVKRWAKAGNEKHPLNSTLVKENGKLVEKVWRAGSKTIPAGLYSSQLNAAISFLEKAIPFAASEYQAETVRLLINYYKTGDPEDFRKFNVHWVKDSSAVDFIQGFIEVYLDPRAQKGEFEALIYYADPEQASMMKRLATLAQYFEDRAPWKDEYKKKIDHSPIANVINVIIGIGGSGPVSFVGVNLPNDQSTREQYGTKSILLYNVQDAIDKSSGEELTKEFAWDAEEVHNQELYGSRAENLQTAMHEVIGHGSGRVSSSLRGKDPANFLPGYYNTLEETRADLVALWNAWDPKLVDIGVANDTGEARKIGETMYQKAVQTGLSQLRRIGKSEQLEEDHLKDRQLIVHYIIKNSKAIQVVKREGKTYYHIVDFNAARSAVGELLAEVMRIKAEGDLPAGKRLIDRYGLRVNTELRDEVQDRVLHLGLAAYTGFVMPKLEPVSDPTAKIVDVKMSYPLDLAKQMLEWSAFTKPFRTGDQRKGM